MTIDISKLSNLELVEYLNRMILLEIHEVITREKSAQTMENAEKKTEELLIHRVMWGGQKVSIVKALGIIADTETIIAKWKQASAAAGVGVSVPIPELPQVQLSENDQKLLEDFIANHSSQPTEYV